MRLPTRREEWPIILLCGQGGDFSSLQVQHAEVELRVVDPGEIGAPYSVDKLLSIVGEGREPRVLAVRIDCRFGNVVSSMSTGEPIFSIFIGPK